jgi:hypothetical protein
VKAQGSSDCGGLFSGQKERNNAMLDAKRRALEKYISGLKSQNEANRLLSMKAQLFGSIDDYVKDATELTSEKKDGRCFVTIQANIDRMMINKVLGDSFKQDSKKAGLKKKKKVAFIFVAREVDTTTNVKAHTQDQSSDSVRARSDQSLDSGAKGESSSREAARGQNESERSSSMNDKRSDIGSGNADLSITQSDVERNTLRQQSKESGSVSARVEGGQDETASMNADATREYAGAAEGDLSRQASLDRKESLKVDSKSDTDRKTKEAESVRYDNSSEKNVAFAAKTRQVQSYRGESDVNKNSEKKVTEIKHSEKKSFRVSEYGTVNAQLTELFMEQGMRVSESLDASEILGQLAQANSVNQIRPGDIKKTVTAAKQEGVDFLLIGTLDVGLERTDSATGNTVREVLINANVYDLNGSGRGLEKAAAVGNLNFSGLGGTPDIAKNNALSTAVKEASVKLIAQTREYILEAAGEE